jgi:hypothetical protein
MAALGEVYLAGLDSSLDSILFGFLRSDVRMALVMIRGIEGLLSLWTYLGSAVDSHP